MAERQLPEGWVLERDVTCVACPDCAFTFDAIHTDSGSGVYSCPLCAEDRLEKEVRLERAARQQLHDALQGVLEFGDADPETARDYWLEARSVVSRDARRHDTEEEHDFQRTVPTDGRWCQRCGLSEVQWSGEPCPGQITPELLEHAVMTVGVCLTPPETRED